MEKSQAPLGHDKSTSLLLARDVKNIKHLDSRSQRKPISKGDYFWRTDLLFAAKRRVKQLASEISL